MKLRDWRLAQGLSPEQLGEAIECTRQAVHRYEKGKVPKPTMMERIVAFTGGAVTPNEWFDGAAS